MGAGYQIKWTITVLLLLWSGIANQALAHEIRPAYLEISEQEDGSFQVLWKIPSASGRAPRLEVVLPGFCSLSLLQTNTKSDAVIRKYRADCSESLAGRSIGISGLENTLIDVLVRIIWLDGQKESLLLYPDKPELMIPVSASGWQVASVYTRLGIQHILEGIDHLLFVLGLMLLITGIGKLVKTITAFTLAHSITLIIATLDIFTLPQAPVEAVIALSIVFLAREFLIMERGKNSLTAEKPWIVAFIFGLLHGFGFAGALREIGLPHGEIPLALFTFNIGVELGQLLFVLVAGIILFFIRKIPKPIIKPVRKIPAYAIGTVAMYWVLIRIFF